jgi:phospholipase C
MHSGYSRLGSLGRVLRQALGISLAAWLFLVPVKSCSQDRPGGLGRINNIIVIYQENWSFDGLYGSFPGANGITNASATSLTQIDRVTGNPYSSQLGRPFDLSVGGPALATPPQPINGSGAIDARFPNGLNTLLPYDFSASVGPSGKTGDIVHRYWQEFFQINGGKMDRFLTWSDNPGLVLSHIDATNLPEGKLAQQYTIADNFFHSAFGGSFLNHQFLIAARAPVFLNADVQTPSSLPALTADGQLALNPATGKIVRDGKVTPKGGPTPTGDTFENFYAVNTIFSTNLVPTFKHKTDTDLLPSQNNSNPNDQVRPYIPTIGDRLSQKGVSWKWYSGGWDAAVDSTLSNPNPAKPATVDPLFQWHHQAFAYYDNFAPFLADGTRNPKSAAHLQDENNFFRDLQNGTLPQVSFIKPLGPDNEHPGYASVLQGQQHVASIVRAVQDTDYWEHTLIIITYDEHGGRWDHVSPPEGDLWGPGSRVPAIFIGPMVKNGFVDHTQYETDSILSLIEARFGLEPLSDHDGDANPLSNIFKRDD